MSNELSNISAQRIKELRLKKGLTMEKLAEYVGVSKSTIAKWENGYVDNMRQERIKKLSEIFEVSPTYIMGYDDTTTARLTAYAKAFTEISKEKEREENFIQLYEKLTDAQKDVVDNMLKILSSEQ